MDIDTFDILAVVIGVVSGMTILTTVPAVDAFVNSFDDMFDWFMLACVVVPLFAKRAFISTPKRPEGMSPVLRMLYLFIAIVGSLSLAGAALLAWEPLKSVGTMGAVWEAAHVPAGLGMALLLVALVLDRVFLTAYD